MGIIVDDTCDLAIGLDQIENCLIYLAIVNHKKNSCSMFHTCSSDVN